MVKDPATGKRVSRVNRSEQQRRANAPQLQIVEEKIWSAAQAIKADKHKAHANTARKPPRLLSGLLRCESCGGGLTTRGADK
jgi:site-specific DNA recombinase